MRILFASLTSDDLGLSSRLLPVTAELRTRGHDVAFAEPAPLVRGYGPFLTVLGCATIWPRSRPGTARSCGVRGAGIVVEVVGEKS